jgi:hypothetical protein
MFQTKNKKQNKTKQNKTCQWPLTLLWLITGKISINLKLRKRYQNSNLMAYVFATYHL